MPQREFDQLIVRLFNALPMEERVRIENMAFEIRCARGEVGRRQQKGWGNRFLPVR